MKSKSMKTKTTKYLPGWLIAIIAALIVGVGVGIILLKIPQFNLV